MTAPFVVSDRARTLAGAELPAAKTTITPERLAVIYRSLALGERSVKATREEFLAVAELADIRQKQFKGEAHAAEPNDIEALRIIEQLERAAQQAAWVKS